MKYFSGLFLFLLISCSAPLELDSTHTIGVEYHFNDSSLPPEYHRSYVITVSDAAIQVTVDSYGDILAESKSPISSEKFEALIQTINTANLVSGENKPWEPCDGGTSASLTVSESGKEVYSGFFDHCAGEIPSSLGDVNIVVEAIESLVPNLDELRR